jgi:hypothetical protein
MSSRREFLKKTAYAAPVIMTLSAKPSYAGQGSNRPPSNSGFDIHEKSSRNDHDRRHDSGHSNRKDKKGHDRD